MKKYALTLKTGETIHTIIAESVNDAIEKFCFTKKFEKDVLLKLYYVVKVD